MFPDAGIVKFFAELACQIAHGVSSVAVPFAEVDPAAKEAVEIARRIIAACAGIA